MKAVSFYHNDMDGKASGYIVHKCMVEPWGLKESIDNYHMKSYDDPFIMDNIDKDTVVFITDLSFSESTVNQLLEICDKAAYVIWIDHHLTSMKLIDSYMFPVDRIKNLISLIDIGGCGALLTYLFSKFSFKDIIKCSGMLNSIGCNFHINRNVIPSANICCYVNSNDYNMITTEIPKWLVYIDDRDRWIKQFPETDNFISGCDIYNTSLFEMNSFTGSRVWNKFWGQIDNNVDKYISEGIIINAFKRSQNYRELKSCFEFTFPNGTKILCKNGRGNSESFLDLIEEYDAVCIFSFNGKSNLWIHSIYTRKGSPIKANEICEKFGGGGHAGAAGFSVPEPIFTNIEYFNKYKYLFE